MGATTNNQVTLRLAPETWARLSAQAQDHCVPLATYLRRRLEEEDHIDAELGVLREVVERCARTPGGDGERGTKVPPGVLVEMLLLLRALAGPQRAAMAQGEVGRRGLEIWR